MTTLDLKDVARILDVSPRTVLNYIHAGILPMRKINGQTSPYKISERKFQKWFDREWCGEYYSNEII